MSIEIRPCDSLNHGHGYTVTIENATGFVVVHSWHADLTAALKYATLKVEELSE
jgi:hypothetical protein